MKICYKKGESQEPIENNSVYHASQAVPVSSFRRVKENKCILTLFLFFIYFIFFFSFDSLNWGLDNNKARSPTEASCGLGSWQSR